MFCLQKRDIYDEFKYDLDSIEFIVDGVNKRVSEMSIFGKELFRLLGIHIAYRLLKRTENDQLPMLYIYCLISNPYTKEYAPGILGEESNLKKQHDYLKQALELYLPKYKGQIHSQSEAIDHDWHNQYTSSQSSSSSFSSNEITNTSKFKSKKQPEFMTFSTPADAIISSFLNFHISSHEWTFDATLDGVLFGIHNCKVLHFWSTHDLFPEMKALNMILLSTDISSASCEAYFSLLKETITPRRMMMGIERMSKYLTLRYMEIQRVKIFEEERRSKAQTSNHVCNDDKSDDNDQYYFDNF